jgi:DNA-directed RNA polymerase specialized sigma24 family protein
MTPDEFAAFYTHWQPHLVRYFGWKMGHWQDAEDLAQVLFTDLARRAAELRLETAHRYMWVAARRVAAMARHSLSLAPLTFDPMLVTRKDASYDTSSTPTLTRTVYGLASQIVQPEDQAVVNGDELAADLASLKPRERAVIDATVIGSETLRAHARRVGLSEGRAYQIRSVGLNRLRRARQAQQDG